MRSSTIIYVSESPACPNRLSALCGLFPYVYTRVTSSANKSLGTARIAAFQTSGVIHEKVRGLRGGWGEKLGGGPGFGTIFSLRYLGVIFFHATHVQDFYRLAWRLSITLGCRCPLPGAPEDPVSQAAAAGRAFVGEGIRCTFPGQAAG